MDKILKKLGFSRKTLLYFLIIASSSQIIFSLNAIKSVAYEPFREMLGVSNTQLGLLFSLPGIVQMIFMIPAGYFQNRVSSRKMLSINLFLVGIGGFLVSTSPAYIILVLVYASFGITQEALFWPTVLKSVRTLGDDDKQGTAFGFLELIRGGWEFITNSLVLILFAVLGQSFLGIKTAIAINSSLIIICSIACWFLIPEETHLQAKSKEGKNKEAFEGLVKAIKMPEVWMVGLAAMCVYSIYIGIQYFLPFMQNVYGLPVVLAGIFGLVNTSMTRTIASPLAGLIGDNKFKSSTHFMNKVIILISGVLLLLIVMPKSKEFTIPVMIVLMLVTILCYMLRGVYYAPIGELKIPRSISGSAMSVAAFIGYSPKMWGYLVYGNILDRFPGTQGYVCIFGIQIMFALIGIVFTYVLGKKIIKRRILEELSNEQLLNQEV